MNKVPRKVWKRK